MVLRVVVSLVGVLFVVQGIGWIADPAGAAEGLGMPLLDGLARSTQIGDFTGFFAGLGSMILLGAWRRDPVWLQAGGLLLGGAAAGRILAWGLHSADFATQFIAVEVVFAALLFFASTRISADSASADGTA
jgi:hypothetical protein